MDNNKPTRNNDPVSSLEINHSKELTSPAPIVEKPLSTEGKRVIELSNNKPQPANIMVDPDKVDSEIKRSLDSGMGQRTNIFPAPKLE
jgi:hypothetical protein